MITKYMFGDTEIIAQLDKDPYLIGVFRNNKVTLANVIPQDYISHSVLPLTSWFAQVNTKCTFNEGHVELLQAGFEQWKNYDFTATIVYLDSKLQEKRYKIQGLEAILKFEPDDTKHIEQVNLR